MPTLTSRRHFLKGAALCAAALACQSPARLWAAVPERAVTETRILLGTFVRISALHTERERAADALAHAFDTVAHKQAIFSRHDTTTPLALLNAQGRIADAPQELTALLQRARRFHSITEGAFDITVAPVLDLARAGKAVPSMRTGAVRSDTVRVDERALSAARELVHMPSLQITGNSITLGRQGMSITLDGIAKGHIADCAAAALQATGITNFLVDAGGDIRAEGHKAPGTPWRVAVENPVKKGAPVAVVPLSGAIATSGGYESYYDATGRHHHIIRPQSGQSPTGVLGTTVTAPDTLTADALATALTVMTPGEALQLIGSLPGIECCLITRQGVVRSVGFGGSKS